MNIQNALTPRDAADELGMSATRVRQLCADRQLDHVRIGRKLWIPISEVQRILTAGFYPRRTA